MSTPFPRQTPDFPATASHRASGVESRPLVRFFLGWLPALLWLALVLCASADPFSATQTSRFFVPLLHWLFPHLSPWRVMQIHAFVRKGAHLTEYAILAILFWRALRHSFWLGQPRDDSAQKRPWLWRPALGALAAAAFCAVADEYHQSFVPSRTSSARDVALDICGASLALLLLWAGFTLRRRVPEQAPARVEV
jgi:VanZ family protein